MFTVAVLGAVEVRRDGELVPLPAGKTTELVVRLALDAGSRVRVDTLLADLWPGPVGRNTLQSKVSQLRRALGDPAAVVGAGDAYALAVEPSDVDAHRLVQLAAEAAAAWHDGEPATALDRATAGLALFHGAGLVDLGDWSAPYRARLAGVRVDLCELAMAARVELGSGSDVVTDLEALVEEHPLREGLWASLVTALYRAGRQAEALAAYSRVRAVLVDDLGVEPGPRLRALERQVLRQSPVLDPADARPAVAVPGNLPGTTAPLVGRAGDLQTLAVELAQHRLVTVVGTAGVGKTRLALESARRLTNPGGVWLVRLDEADANTDLPQLVAETIGVATGKRALVERLAGAETVLVLDNCEHLVEPVARLVRTLLEAAPAVRVLATSQVALGVDDELLHPLEPLTPSDAVALFAAVAATMRRPFVLDAPTTSVVERVCRALDGLPLAIELAAARVRSLSVQDIARRLDDRFALLRDPSSHRPERSRALASAIAWSYELLFPDDQSGLWALSCFPGGASLDALEHVVVSLGVPRPSVIDVVGRLVDRSLVALDVSADGSVRYRLLDSIRAFAADRLREAGRDDVAAGASAGWYADIAVQCNDRVRGAAQAEVLTFVRVERANIDAALAWCARHDPDLGVRIANGFGWTWVVLGDGTAGATRVRDATAGASSPRERATGRLLAGWLEASAGDVTLAQSDLDAVFATAAALGDELLIADAHRHHAFLSIQQGRPHDVLAHAAAGLSTYRELGLDWPIAGSLLLAAFGALMLGDTTAAARDAGEAKVIVTAIDDAWALVHADAMLGAVAQAEHRFDDAAVALREAAERARTLGFGGQAALHLATLGRVLQRAGDPGGAAVRLEQAIAAAGAVGDGRLAATARLHLARIRRGAGDHAGAVALLDENTRWYRTAGGGDGALLNRCLSEAERGDRTALERTVDEARRTGLDEVSVYALDALAALAAAAVGDAARARELLAEADALAPAVAHLIDPLDRFDGILARQLLASEGNVDGDR